jgi:DNA-binding transcriptional MerR regulator
VSTYRISELARRTGVPASTLRFYEQAGLLPAGRTGSGYRVYGEEAVARLEFIGSAKHLGLPLEEIRELLAAWEQGVCAAVRERLRPLVAARIAETQQRIAELTAFAAHLTGVHDELGGPARAAECGPGCGCVRAGPPGPVPVSVGLVPRRMDAGAGAAGSVSVELAPRRVDVGVPGVGCVGADPPVPVSVELAPRRVDVGVPGAECVRADPPDSVPVELARRVDVGVPGVGCVDADPPVPVSVGPVPRRMDAGAPRAGCVGSGAAVPVSVELGPGRVDAGAPGAGR